MSHGKTLTVRDLDVLAEGSWNFDTSQVTFDSNVFDPFPAYSHDLDLVTELAREVVRCCPNLYDITVHNANRECVGRFNAYARHRDGEYVDGEWDKTPRGTIVLMAKRIPPHPGMTEHLVGHEYGHHVNYMLNMARGKKSRDWDLLYEYAQMRGYDMTQSKHSGAGGTWASSIQEIFATDFRYWVCGLERVYWPHPGAPKPEDVPGLDDWWGGALQEIADYDPTKAQEEEE